LKKSNHQTRSFKYIEEIQLVFERKIFNWV